LIASVPHLVQSHRADLLRILQAPLALHHHHLLLLAPPDHLDHRAEAVVVVVAREVVVALAVVVVVVVEAAAEVPVAVAQVKTKSAMRERIHKVVVLVLRQMLAEDAREREMSHQR